MNDKEKEKLSLAMYNIVLSIRDNITLPTHGTISKVLILSIAMLIMSLISSIAKFYTFVSWQGCLICVAVLLVLLWVERAENDTLIKAYQAGAKYAKKAETVMKGHSKQSPSTKKGVKKKK